MIEKYLYIVSQKCRLKGNFIQHLISLINASQKSCLAGLILREKEISKEQYTDIVKEIAFLCHEKKLDLYLNTDITLAFHLAKKYSCHIQTSFENYLFLVDHAYDLENIKLTVSIHSEQEAEIIVKNNETSKIIVKNILLGHIFETECKKGLKARGLLLLEKVNSILEAKTIKLIAIGGINQERARSIYSKNRISSAVMSLAMQEEMDEKQAKTFLQSFETY